MQIQEKIKKLTWFEGIAGVDFSYRLPPHSILVNIDFSR